MASLKQGAMSTQVVFDARSGRILCVHHGVPDETHVRERTLLPAHRHEAKGVECGAEHMDVITVASDAIDPEKRYKVDIATKTLVATDTDGVGFGFGMTASSF
jgi:hypothetical protein